MRRILLPAILGFACGTASAQSTPETVRSLPAPSGPNAVGTTVAYLTDESRIDKDFPQGRPITLQLWYPASTSSGSKARYLFDPGLGPALLRIGYYGIDSAALSTWDTLRTHATIDAAPKTGRHPLVTFSVGLAVIRANYTAFATELASHGYIVALVESPFAGFMVRPRDVEVNDTTDRLTHATEHRKSVNDWAGDVSFVLDQLANMKVPPAAQRVAATVDSARIGAAGHSSGGLVALAVCETDRRVSACINMDGGLAGPDREPITDVANTGVKKPTLFLRSQPIYSDADLARRGLTREAWEKRAEPGRIAFDAFASRSRGPLWVAFVAGTGHFSFSDAPYVMPSAINRFGGRIIDADRGQVVITTVMRRFFDRQLRRDPSMAADLGVQLPEVTVTRSKP